MQKFRLKISEQDFNQLKTLVFADLPNEAGAFALAGQTQYSSNTDILVRQVVPVPQELFMVQSELRLEIAPRAINGLVSLCENFGLGAILCHSHPSNSPYSPSDDHGEQRIFNTLRQFIPLEAPTASLLFYPGGVRGRVWLPQRSNPVPISEIIVIGKFIRHIKPDMIVSENVPTDEVFDRQVRAFGTVGQKFITQTRVGIIGVGGTGSAVAEQIARLGTKDFVLIDPDNFEPSNITRMYGTFEKIISRFFRSQGSSKVELIAAHLKQINPKVKVRTIPKNVVLTHVARELLDRDILFLCTDEHWGRSIVNSISYQYLIPTINLGATIEKDALGGSGIVDVLRPEKPCLWCKEYLRPERIRAESTPKSQRAKLRQEAYVVDIDTPAPSVISINTTVAGLAVTQFIQLLTDFMSNTGDISRLNYNIMDGTIRRGTTLIPEKCLCKQVKGYGDLKPLLTIEDVGFLEL